MNRQKTKQKTLKETPEDKLRFIGKVVKKSLKVEKTSWDMTVTGAAMLSLASKGLVGMALYMLDKIDPQPNTLITDRDIVDKFPLGFEGNWEKEWNQFSQGDQRRVFKR